MTADVETIQSALASAAIDEQVITKDDPNSSANGGPQVQSDPPRVGLSKIYTDGIYPEGEIMEYTNDNAYRYSSSELRALEKTLQADPAQTYQDIRRAAEVHRLVRAHANRTIKPGMTLTEIAENIEAGTRALVEEHGLDRGIGFPTGVNLNEIAAHFSPNAGDKTILRREDVMKVDFGVHVNGRIVDSAFTMSFEPTYDELLKAVKDATNTGIKEAGIDVRLCDIGESIQEVMESYEVVIGTETKQVKAIANLNGHSINPYEIHGGKSVPIVKNNDETKMEEGEYFAIETFGSTGRGRVIEDGVCSHYARSKDYNANGLRRESSKSLLKTINKNFDSLPFCRRYLDRIGESGYLLGLNELVSTGIVMDYPPLTDIKGSMTAQYEHTILLRPTCKEVVSRGTDY
ncbi:peptidase methionine aminopeptidase [Phaffia rhodozyma]|uniref:Methionine aminopeptidase 2 n=1 Tax=Phaffia rhodozyma TaxID=264483 RepID=A0A0F7SS69_PHARH|nr:peptidase methionine aminopeptidase [Phaffia rhodozyma]